MQLACPLIDPVSLWRLLWDFCCQRGIWIAINTIPALNYAHTVSGWVEPYLGSYCGTETAVNLFGTVNLQLIGRKLTISVSISSPAMILQWVAVCTLPHSIQTHWHRQFTCDVNVMASINTQMLQKISRWMLIRSGIIKFHFPGSTAAEPLRRAN